MKTLILLRHAKAELAGPSVRDINRVLTAQGEKDALAMAGYLRGLGIGPQVILTSPALRAKITAAIFADCLKLSGESVLCDKSLYCADIAALYNAVWGLDNSVSKAVIVGHNPGLSLFLAELCQNARDDLPSCGLAVIKINKNEWSMIKNNSGNLTNLQFPAGLVKL